LRLIVRTYSNELPSRCFLVFGVEEIEFTTSYCGGFIDATIKLNRIPGVNYTDIGFNYHLEIVADDGDVVWEGSIFGIQPSASGDYTYEVTAIGYSWLMDGVKSLWQPSYTSNTDVGQIIRAGVSAYAPGIILSTITVPDTSRLITYTPENAASVLSHLDELVKYGNTTNTLLQWQIWNGRKLYVQPRPAVAEPAYTTTLKEADSYSTGLNAETFYTQVTVKYRDYLETKTITRSNSTMQQRYGTVFGSSDPTATVVNYVREPSIVDVTNHGIITASQAGYIADTMLAHYSSDGIRFVASSISLNDNSRIFDYKSGMQIPLSKVRAGQVVSITDMNQAPMFIGQTRFSYSDNKSRIELTSDASQSADDLLGGLLNITQAEPE
jgi:hypothetical protein